MKSEIAEDVVTDPMVFCTTVYIVIYILLLLQSFVASSVQFVNEGTWEFRVCSTLYFFDLYFFYFLYSMVCCTTAFHCVC